MARKAPPSSSSRDWLPAGRTMELAAPGYDPVMEAIATSQYRDALSPQPPTNRMRSLSLSLPWRRTRPSRNLSVPHHSNDLAIEDEAADLHENPRPRGHSHGHSQHNNGNGLKGIFRRASVSLKGMVNRRPSAATEDAIWEDQPFDYGQSRPTTSHLGGNRTRHPQTIRHYGSFHGLNLTAEPLPINDRPTHTSYHARPGLGREPPVIPHNTGGAAKAAAAMQNELFRSVPTLHYPTIPDEKNDDESGVGIAVTVTEDKEATISKVDFIVSLPTELAIQVLTYLDATALAKASQVCQHWSKIVSNPHVWRESCLRETTKTFAMSGPIKANSGMGVPPSLPNMDWKKIYRANTELKKRWLEGKARAVYLNGHTDSIYCLQFDEHKIITGSRDKTVRVWDMHTFECRLIIGPPDIVGEKELLFDNGAPSHFTTQADGQKSSSSMPTPLSFDQHHKQSILCLQYDDEILATGSSDGTCIIHDIKNGYKPIRRLRHHTAAILDLAFDDKHIVTCSKDISICVWDRRTGALLRQLRGHAGPVNAVQMRGNTIVSCSGDFRVKLWNIDTGKNIREFVGHTKGLACSQFSEDGRYVASAGNDKTIRIWDANTGECLYRMFAHDNLVRSLHIDSVSGRLVSGSYDTDIKVWDMNTGRQLLEFPKWHASWVLSAKSDYRRIVSTGQDPKILIMDFGADVDGIELLESEGQRVGAECGFI